MFQLSGFCCRGFRIIPVDFPVSVSGFLDCCLWNVSLGSKQVGVEGYLVS